MLMDARVIICSARKAEISPRLVSVLDSLIPLTRSAEICVLVCACVSPP